MDLGVRRECSSDFFLEFLEYAGIHQQEKYRAGKEVCVGIEAPNDEVVGLRDEKVC